jgi:hypothetical protein
MIDDKIKMMLPATDSRSAECRRSVCDGLLKCPFCGNHGCDVKTYMAGCAVKCGDCGAEGPEEPLYTNGRGPECAKKAWNKRAL